MPTAGSGENSRARDRALAEFEVMVSSRFGCLYGRLDCRHVAFFRL